MILKNIRYLVTQNSERQILENIDLQIQEDKISGLGRNLSTEGHEVIDCSDKVVMPGLVNAHTHAAMTLLRGISDNKELQAWLEEDIFPAEEKMGPKEVYIGSLLGCVEMLESGTTTFNDMYAEMDEVGRAIDRTGIRAVLGRGLMDMDDRKDERMDDALELIKRFEDHDRIKTNIAPHSIYTASEQLLKESKEASEILGKKLHTHVSETEKENSDSMDERGLTPVQYLDELDLVNEDLIAAHCVHLKERDKEILNGKNASIVHNPSANLKLGSGMADIPELVDRDINVALGTDGVASNNNLNLFEEMKIASILHKRKSPENITERQVLDMATINGAKALGLEDEIGSIEIDKKADLITINLNRPEMNPVHGKRGIISNLVYSFSGDVDEVIVNGELVLDKGRILGIEASDLSDSVNKLGGRIR
ncbi:MAG: amidohydrolase [Candidatus Nanohaloarchaea archaeon]